MDIRTYIQDGGSFRQGVELLEQYAPRQAGPFRRLLKKPYVDPRDKARLLDLLKGLDVPGESHQVVSVEAPSNAPTHRNQSTSPDPPAIQEYRQRGRLLKKKESFLHAQLVTRADDPESNERTQALYDLAGQILSVEQQLDEVYDAIREYESTGTLPVTGKAAIIADTVQKMQRRNSLRSMVYRLRKKADKESDATKKDILTRDLAEKEGELQVLEKDLGL